jgi:hypothetical protein
LCSTTYQAPKTYPLLNEAPRHEGVWESGGIVPRILDLCTRWRWVVSFTPGCFTPSKRTPGTHWIGGWVGSRASLDAVVKRKIPDPYRDLIPDHPALSPSVFGLEKVDQWNPIRTSAIQSRPRPMRFLGFSNHENGAPMQEISKWSTVCSTFSRSGWSVVRCASLAAKGGTSKKRPSPHLHKVPTRSNEVSPWAFPTAPVFTTKLRLPLRPSASNIVRIYHVHVSPIASSLRQSH